MPDELRKSGGRGSAEQEMKDLKKVIKEWERAFLEREGRKPDKNDIYEDKWIAKRYKLYAKIKSSAGNGGQEKEESPARRRERTRSSTAENSEGEDQDNRKKGRKPQRSRSGSDEERGPKSSHDRRERRRTEDEAESEEDAKLSRRQRQHSLKSTGSRDLREEDSGGKRRRRINSDMGEGDNSDQPSSRPHTAQRRREDSLRDSRTSVEREERPTSARSRQREGSATSDKRRKNQSVRNSRSPSPSSDRDQKHRRSRRASEDDGRGEGHHDEQPRKVRSAAAALAERLKRSTIAAGPISTDESVQLRQQQRIDEERDMKDRLLKRNESTRRGRMRIGNEAFGTYTDDDEPPIFSGKRGSLEPGDGEQGEEYREFMEAKRRLAENAAKTINDRDQHDGKEKDGELSSHRNVALGSQSGNTSSKPVVLSSRAPSNKKDYSSGPSLTDDRTKRIEVESRDQTARRRSRSDSDTSSVHSSSLSLHSPSAPKVVSIGGHAHQQHTLDFDMRDRDIGLSNDSLHHSPKAKSKSTTIADIMNKGIDSLQSLENRSKQSLLDGCDDDNDSGRPLGKPKRLNLDVDENEDSMLASNSHERKKKPSRGKGSFSSDEELRKDRGSKEELSRGQRQSTQNSEDWDGDDRKQKSNPQRDDEDDGLSPSALVGPLSLSRARLSGIPSIYDDIPAGYPARGFGRVNQGDGRAASNPSLPGKSDSKGELRQHEAHRDNAGSTQSLGMKSSKQSTDVAKGQNKFALVKSPALFKRIPPGHILQCKLIRRGNMLERAFPTFVLYNEADHQFLLAARKRKKSVTAQYVISMSEDDLSKDSVHCLGFLKANFAKNTFILQDVRPRGSHPSISPETLPEIACVQYVKSTLPRQMLVAVPALDIENDKTSDFSHNIIADMSSKNTSKLQFMKNKKPQWNEETKGHFLNFGGRVTESSVKNFQIVMDDNDEYITMQFGRRSKEEFTLDMRWPLTPVEAFAIALSSFDVAD
ncbi:hypothetical protein HDU97_002014 [Phlyctochytrium planicorne]|nr:hypothetical protein HDU97_002014 [Phlyctochytrium planicorne]